jgi:peptidyl-tRNA hydrolase
LRKTNITSLKKIKIGIGRPQEKSDIINYVLNEFPSSEKEKIVKLIKINIIPFIINEIINI